MVDIMTDLGAIQSLREGCKTSERYSARHRRIRHWWDHPDAGNGKMRTKLTWSKRRTLDDANVPSLLSIPYLGVHSMIPKYSRQHAVVYPFPHNPTYRKGLNIPTGEIEGYGSPHMSQAIRDNIWPMVLAVQGLIVNDSARKDLN
jgi:hypothetical protein